MLQMERNLRNNNAYILVLAILTGIIGAIQMFHSQNLRSGMLAWGIYMGAFTVSALNVYWIHHKGDPE